jgi:glutamyl-tRNA synthetase
MDRPVTVRIAPSPTGDPHVGTAYIALFNYAFAKQRGGRFLLRIEDTDQARSTKESEVAILAALRWLGIEWDVGPDKPGAYGSMRQSERLPIYKEHVEKLVASGHAYWCDCTKERLDAVNAERRAAKQNPGYDGHCRELKKTSGAVIRLKVPRGDGAHTVVNDLLRDKAQVFDHHEVDDQVLLKSDGFPTYHLACVVDDHLMEVTHVLRGEEWLSSTPKHVLLYQAFGWEPPKFAHLPLLRNADKSKVSKRKNPVSLSYFRECGYLPDVMVNFLGTMAFTFEDGREIFTLQDFVQHFTLERISLGGPVFDLKKLQWLNGKYLREMRTDAQLAEYASETLFSRAYLERVMSLCKARVDKAEDLVDFAPYFFTNVVTCDPKDLVVKEKTAKESAAILEAFVEAVDTTFDWRSETVSALIARVSQEQKIGDKDLLGPLRWLATGKKGSPPIHDVLAVLGRERTRTRIRAVLAPLKAYVQPATKGT